MVKFLGKAVSFYLLWDRLKMIWKSFGGFEIVDIGHSFYMLKFDLEVDMTKMMEGGLWKLFDHYPIDKTMGGEVLH